MRRVMRGVDGGGGKVVSDEWCTHVQAEEETETAPQGQEDIHTHTHTEHTHTNYNPASTYIQTTIPPVP